MQAPLGVPVSLEQNPVIEAYKKHVDRTLLRENLRRTPTERLEMLIAMQRIYLEARRSDSERRGR